MKLTVDERRFHGMISTMANTLYDPNMPLTAFADACRLRVEELEAQLDAMRKERHALMQFLNGYSVLQGQLGLPGSVDSRGQSANNILEAFRTSRTAEVWNKLRSMPQGVVSDASFGLADVRVDSTNNEKILAFVANFLADGRKKTAELVELLNKMGMHLNSPNQQSLLSTLMSKDDRFVASRKLGWGLKGRDDVDGDPGEDEAEEEE